MSGGDYWFIIGLLLVYYWFMYRCCGDGCF